MASKRKRKKVAATKKNRQESRKKLTQPQINFGLKDSIGQSGAEDDTELLSKCFYPGAVYDIMKDIKDPKSILIGGTGAGKTAFIEQFHKENTSNCVRLHLNEVSFSYISNSNLLNNLEEIGINLNLSYQILWKHFLVIQLLKQRIKPHRTATLDDLIIKLSKYFENRRIKTKAQEYLEKLNRDFWLEPNECIHKTSEEMIRSLGGGLGIGEIASMEAEQIKKIRSDQTQISKIQTAIDEPLLQILNTIFDYLNDDIFTDDQNPYYVVIDELDTNWVVQERKYALIRALIETIRAFRNVENVKILVGLRTDLYDRIIDATKDEGFQHEKYETYLLPINWQKYELLELINLRIQEVFKDRFTKETIGFTDIAPEKVNDIKCFDYMLNRTFQRPRHIIMFINACLSLSIGKTKFSQMAIKDGEKKYSLQRLRAVKDEWIESYKLMDYAISLLDNKNSNFEISKIPFNQVLDTALEINTSSITVAGFDLNLKRYAGAAFDDDKPNEKFLSNLFKMLHHIGLVGIKLSAGESYEWYYVTGQNISAASITLDTSVKVHPMFWRALHISSK